MSNNERMDRAKRIRRMREGNRDGDNEDDANSETHETTPQNGDAQTDEVQTDTETTVDAASTSTDESSGTSSDESDTASSSTENGQSSESQTANGATSQQVAETSEAAMETVQDRETDQSQTAAEDGAKAPLPDAEQLEQALEQEDGASSEAETVEPAVAEQTADEDQESAEQETEEKDETRVLEFSLAGEHYCLDIQYIEEIVKQDTITRVPNTPDHVEGVVDLRGQITTILNPKVSIGKDDQEPGELIVVFDSDAFDDQGYIGWIVDDVRQVSPITEGQINDPPMGEDYINGVIDREGEDQFVIWTTPELAFEDSD